MRSVLLQLTELGDGPDLYPRKSSSRASFGKGLKSKEDPLDEGEMSDTSPVESAGSVQDQVNIGALEADSRAYQLNQQNGEMPPGLGR